MKGLKYFFEYYGHGDQRMTERYYSYDGDKNIGIVICPECERLIEIKREIRAAKGVCECGITITLKK